MTLAHGPAPRPRLRAAALTALLVGSGAAHAQSLKELYDAARAYDATYLAARALADSVQYKVEQARALERPSVGLQAQVQHVRSNVKDSGYSGSYAQTVDTQSTTPSAAVNFTYSLYNRGNSATISQSEKQLVIAQADLQAAEQDLIVRLGQAYFDVLAAQDALGTAQTSKKAISEQLASAKRNFEVGTATITDTREAQARFDLATAQELAAENDLRAKRIALDQLVGRSGVTPATLKVPVQLPAPDPVGVDDWVKRVDDAPTVRKAQLALDVARLETEKARAASAPTVTLNGGLSLARGPLDVETSTTTAAGSSHLDVTRRNVGGSVGIALAMPLYSGGAIQNRVKETVSLEEQSRNTLEAARRTVAQVTRTVFFGVQSGLAQVKALEAAESSSKLAMEATLLGYKVGVRVNLDVLNAQTQLYTTQRDLAKARYDVVLNSLKLRQAAGVLSAADVEATNALLAR